MPQIVQSVGIYRKLSRLYVHYSKLGGFTMIYGNIIKSIGHVWRPLKYQLAPVRKLGSKQYFRAFDAG